MDIYIDTANLEEIKTAISWGIVDGITTNPSLIKKEVERLKAAGQTVDMAGHIKNILHLAGQDVPVSLEVTGITAAEMVNQGKKLYADFNGVAGNVVVKIPINTNTGEGNSFEGLKAIKTLEDQEIPVNCTLIFTPEQALLAANAGATYISPFVGRVDDEIRTQGGIEFDKTDYFPSEGWEAEPDEDGEEDTLDDNGIVSGVDLITKISELFEKHEIDSNILAASLRNARQVREVALAGAEIGTIPFSVLKSMIEHKKTVEGMQKFTADVVPEYKALMGAPGATPPPIHRPAPPQEAPKPATPPSTGQQPTNPQQPPAYGQRPQGQ